MTLVARIKSCTRCPLRQSCTQVVLGRGDPTCGLWYIGEAPGREEDEQGHCFVGRAGRLLNLLNIKAGIKCGYIDNLVKCRPPENRNPEESEVSACVPWLEEQLAKYEPKVIVAMGRFSLGYFHGYDWAKTKSMAVTKEVFGYAEHNGRIIVSTCHPAYLCRNSEAIPGFLSQLRLAHRLYNKHRAK